jgi:hypothetical protein
LPIIGGLCFIIGIGIFSYAFVTSKKAPETLAVTGSARVKVTSDSVKWTSSFSRNVLRDNLKDGYAQMSADEKNVAKFLKDNGLKDEEISIDPVLTNEIYKSDQNAPKEYTLSQSVEVSSTDVQKIASLAKNIQGLVDQGVFFTNVSIEYYYTKLPETRISLLPDALKDAKARAEKIAEATGKKLGVITSADTGSVQVLAPNSVDINDYGSYDTSSIDKDVMITVHPTFELK